MDIDLSEVKRELSELIKKDYGSVRSFSFHKDSKKLGIEKMVSLILSSEGKNSLRVINVLREKYGLPIIGKNTKITRTVEYFEIEEDGKEG